MGRGEFFNHDILIGIDANVAGDQQRLSRRFRVRFEVCVLQQRQRGRLGERAAGADGHEVVLRFDDIAVARDDE